MDTINFDISCAKGCCVLVMGDFMIDEYLQGSVSRISPEAPVPVVNITKTSKRLGGAGNVVLNLNALGAKVTTVGLIGHDAGADWLINQLDKEGVDTHGVMQSGKVITSIKTRVTAKHQQLLRYDQEQVQNPPLDFITFLKDNIDELLSSANAVILSDYGKGVITKDTAALVINAAKRKSIPVMVDPKGTNYSKYLGATACTPNMKEFQEAVGYTINSEEDIQKAGLELCNACQMKFVLATRSEKGMSLITGNTNQKEDYPAIAKEVIDVTGAGDTVISVFTLCYALGASLADCCRIANLAASIVVSKFGAAVPSAEGINELIHEGYRRAQRKKILTWKEAESKVQQLHKEGKKVVFTNGCFDIVHAGHISSFVQARKFGDTLFLGLNSDESIRRNKGEQRPIVSQENRIALLEAISYIDYIVLFEDDTPESLIQYIKPDILVKGKDWEGKEVAGSEFIKNNGGKVCYIDLEMGLSTTNIINKILATYHNENSK